MDLVLTVIGPDRPGLVESLSRTVADHDASWMESRMARLGGQFAGILRVVVGDDFAESLARDLRALETQGLRVVVETSGPTPDPPPQHALHLELVGQDRPGIIRDISRALARRSVNVDQLETECTSAPMSGEPLFKARAQLRVPSAVSLDSLRESLEEIADDLMVDVTLDAED